jgi:hypothetical protein
MLSKVIGKKSASYGRHEASRVANSLDKTNPRVASDQVCSTSANVKRIRSRFETRHVLIRPRAIPDGPPTIESIRAIVDEELMDIIDDDDGESFVCGDDFSDSTEPEIDDPEEKIDAFYQRKAAIVIELFGAGAKMADMVSQFSDEIDDVLLQIVAQRLASSASFERNSPAYQTLKDLDKMLRYEFSRKTASPSVRLLDDVLHILGDNPSRDDYEKSRREAAARMLEDFSGTSDQVMDIFAAAAALAENPALAGEELSTEAIDYIEFRREVDEVLGSARETQVTQEEDVKNFELQYEYVKKEMPHLLEVPEVKGKILLLQVAKEQAGKRSVTIAQLEDVLYMSLRIMKTQKGAGG